jgi:hypothetical protein
MPQRMHMSLSVRGMLCKTDRELRKDMKWITHEDGTPFASVHELRNEFFDTLAKGIEVLPMGDCDNFDPKTGCRGHEIPEPATEAAACETPTVE